jgi:hypothetical protein
MNNKNQFLLKYWIVTCLLMLLCLSFVQSAQVALISNPGIGTISFAAGEVKKSLSLQGHTVNDVPLAQLSSAAGEVRIVLCTTKDAAALSAGGITAPSGLKAEGFAIRVITGVPATYWIIGADHSGAMYGGFELAELISMDGLGSVQDQEQNPHLEKRGIKLNIPLDARTPSYADFGDAAQKNIIEMWSWDFWTNHLDNLARNRYNAITLWSLHHFPSIVKVPDYPNVALDDVKQSTYDFYNNHGGYANPGTNMYDRSVSAPLKTLKTISIDDKIKFWQDVMQYAHDRGIQFYLITWNVFMSSAGDAGYGITDSESNGTTKDYLRKSVAAALKTYPLLAGIGVTAGENLGGDKEGWLWDTYGEGFMDAYNDPDRDPNRNFEFIHRYWMTSMSGIKSEFNFPDDVTFNFSHKYAKARLYSGTNPTFIDGLLGDLPGGSRFWLNLRNDDIFNFRWGDPGYVRDFINNMPGNDKIVGFHMGSDGYVWGREHTSTEPETPRLLEVEKHWYKFMLWGRLGYNPNLTDAKFQQMIQRKFPQVPASELMDVWARASKIIPKVNRTEWHDWDFQWAVEYCRSKGGIETDISGGSGDANELRGHASYVLDRVNALRAQGGKELRLTAGDLEAMAHLGNFYAARMDGTDREAAGHWRKYAAVASSQYNRQLLGRAGQGDWRMIYESFDNNAPSISATGGGTVLEAEEATLGSANTANSIGEATGSGYATTGSGSSIEWTYNAAQAGEYILEFRYALAQGDEGDLSVTVNGTDAGTVKFWNTGGSNVWAWDRKVVNLTNGGNTIKLDIEGISPSVDHLNILSAGTPVHTGKPKRSVEPASLQSLSQRGISFHLPEAVDVNIQVLDVQARVKYKRSRSFQTPGVYHISFEEAGLKPGLYFIRFTAGQSQITRKFYVIE